MLLVWCESEDKRKGHTMHIEHEDPAKGKWDLATARDWGDRIPWLCGFNYLPSGAVNFLEMWRGATFDPEMIDRELGWAAAIGFNAVRTNLHYLDWVFDRDGLVDRVDRFLDIASRHGIATMLCLFDDCEFSGQPPQWGPQPEPRPGVHNSCAIGSPGRHLVGKADEWPFLRGYVQDILTRFGQDGRVVVWDLYNEPGNRAIFSDGATQGLHCDSLEPASQALMRAAFAWAREVAPRQPLTVALWRIGAIGSDPFPHPIDKEALVLSDVVSFHAYCPLPQLRYLAEAMQATGRPVFCTEWMARTIDSRIAEQLPYFRERKVGAFQWGLVKGRSQTYLPWPGFSGVEALGNTEWFHDILTEDGEPYSASELETIRALQTERV